MKYFIVRQDKKYKNTPIIKNWIQNYDIKSLQEGRYSKLPSYQSFFIEPSENTVFLDILVNPYFLCSLQVKKVLELFEPNMKYHDIVLIDKTTQTVNQYFLPELKPIDCLLKESVFDKNHFHLEKAVLNPDKIGQTSIFRLHGVEEQTVVIRLDLVEMLLRKGIKGLSIFETAIKEPVLF
ncbi:MAG: hypothetical protein IKL07_01205 [Clostridium sp.]|nr:hypothetical protein [Clostridium sp.]